MPYSSRMFAIINLSNGGTRSRLWSGNTTGYNHAEALHAAIEEGGGYFADGDKVLVIETSDAGIPFNNSEIFTVKRTGVELVPSEA